MYPIIIHSTFSSGAAMSVTIDLPAELEQSVRQHAARSGQDVQAFVVQAVQEKLAKAQTFANLSAPFAAAVAASGLDEAELDQLFEEARTEVWQEKQGRRP